MQWGWGTSQAIGFRFSGRGWEYFRIWIVNLVLSILTLGIYSAWAKVRRLQYFYRNTSLAGSSFDYHGDPKAILKGRVIVVALLVLYIVADSLNPVLGLGAMVMLPLLIPWLIQRSLRFRLQNTSFRGVRFGFDGSIGGAYKTFYLWPTLSLLTFGLLWPLAHQRIKAYLHGNTRYGNQVFRFTASVGSFYGIYLKLLGMYAILTLVIIAIGNNPPDPDRQPLFAASVGILFVLSAYLFILLWFFWFKARLHNMVWNGTALGQHVFFVSDVRARELIEEVWISLSNLIGIVLTLGLFKPFADIRIARHRLEHMTLNVQGSLDEFVAVRQEKVAGIGEEAVEFLPFDISH